MTAPPTAATTIPPMIHGSAAVAAVAVAGATVGDGVGVIVAPVEGVGVGVGGGRGRGRRCRCARATVNASSPEIGCPSLETTFHSTVTAPDAAPASGCVSTLSCTVG